MINILGFYRRDRDATEYIHFQEDGREYLTNGVVIWDQEIKGKLDQLEKTGSIDLGSMKGWLQVSHPYSNITKHYGMLTFDEFCQYICDHIKKYFPRNSGYENSRVSLVKVNKRNDTPLTALVIKNPAEDISPIIYLDRYFDIYEKQGKGVREILYDIADNRLGYVGKEFISDEHIRRILDLEKVKDRIIIKPIGYEKNKENLEGKIPFYRMGDIVATYHIVMSYENGISASAIINNEMMKQYHITPQELHHLAVKNTAKNFPGLFLPMSEVMASLTGTADFIDSPLYVLTNRQKDMGSAVVFYPDIMDRIAQKYPEGFYVIPSSIHEMLILSKNLIPCDQIRIMTKSINGAVVAPEEVLSDEIHEYDPVSKELYISGSELPSKMRDTKEHQNERKQGKMR